MAEKTDIQWCDSTVNPTSGCDGCELWLRGKIEVCYAGQHHTRFQGSKAYPGPFEEVHLHPGRMAQAARLSDLTGKVHLTGKTHPHKPWLDGLPRIIFIGDMSDVLSRDVPFEYLRDEVVGAITSTAGARHLWMLLTKQTKPLVKFARRFIGGGGIWPSNLISGTSVTTQARISRVADLLKVPGRRFISAEPLWEAVNLGDLSSIDLVIAGGQSRKGAADKPCRVEWLRDLRDQCREAGVCFFLKQLGANVWEDGRRLRLRDSSHGGDWSEWPEDLRVREFPGRTRFERLIS
jgi:protein gp37